MFIGSRGGYSLTHGVNVIKVPVTLFCIWFSLQTRILGSDQNSIWSKCSELVSRVGNERSTQKINLQMQQVAVLRRKASKVILLIPPQKISEFDDFTFTHKTLITLINVS